MGKIVQLDDETKFMLERLGHDRMATFQELADEAFRDLLKKHRVPSTVREALKASVQKNRKKH